MADIKELAEQLVNLSVKDVNELIVLFPIMLGWSPNGWLIEDVKTKETDQISLF